MIEKRSYKLRLEPTLFYAQMGAFLALILHKKKFQKLQANGNT